jgi:xylan 1,4-beta-xylosidase
MATRRQFISATLGFGLEVLTRRDETPSRNQTRATGRGEVMRMKRYNPILPGFNPDPAICRRGDDFYIATSSFQWWPGIPIYHSRDLRNWELIGYALTDPSHADLRRIGDGAGIWAPSLTYADGLFWLVFTIASGSRQHTYECHNFLTTAPDPRGPWSEPIYLNSTGNDPSLFHDDDGRKWLVNTEFVWSPGYPVHRGILLQEYSVSEKRLVGPVRNIFRGTELGIPEGAKLYKHNGWYYLMIAEGGTGYGHAVTMARSRNIWGPYEVHPENPILTARDDPQNPIQRAGHADLVTVSGNRVAVVYLASRPIKRRSILGRETFLASARWDEDGWLRLDSKRPQIELPDFGLEEVPVKGFPERDDFDSPELGLWWTSLRQPIGELADLRSRPGWLILRGTPSPPDSFIRPSIIARRIQHHSFSAETLLEFAPQEMQQWAGLICYYDTRHWYFLHRQFDEKLGACIALYARFRPIPRYERLAQVAIPNVAVVRLGVDCDGHFFRFRFALGERGDWQTIGEPQDALVLSDEFVEEHDPVPNYGFTGAHVGLCSYDITGRAKPPAFDWFEYRGYERWLEIIKEGSDGR